MTLKFGLNLRFRNPEAWRRPWVDVYNEHIALAKLAEELGFDGVWVPEHHSVPEGYNPTPMVVLAAIARETSRIKLGTQPILLPLYNPVLLAEEIAVVDVLSNGRVIPGVGAGYRLGDFTALGQRKEERGARMGEACELLVRCLASEEPFTHVGRFYRAENVCIQPRPVQLPHPPIFHAGRSVPAMQRAARLGFSVNVYPHAADRDELYDAYIAGLREAGHDFQGLELAAMGDGFIAETEEEAAALMAPYLATGDSYQRWWTESGKVDKADRLLMEAREKGRPNLTPASQIEAIGRTVDIYRDRPVQVGWYNLALGLPGMDFATTKRSMELFAREVIPAFR